MRDDMPVRLTEPEIRALVKVAQAVQVGQLVELGPRERQAFDNGIEQLVRARSAHEDLIRRAREAGKR